MTERGIFYGVGVGPGDAELLTLKAVRTIEKCEYIAVAVSDAAFEMPVTEEPEDNLKETGKCSDFLEKCVAYQIAVTEIPRMQLKGKIYLPMPMMKDKEKLKRVHDTGTRAVEQVLKRGQNVAFITLGDPSVYSTCLYIHKRLKARGYDTRLIPGVPSFCAAAAALDEGLVENREELHVLPASYGIEEGLKLSGTRVLMKTGKKMPYVREAVQREGFQIRMVENCGMKQEKIYRKAEEMPETASYYSLLIIKEEQT